MNLYISTIYTYILYVRKSETDTVGLSPIIDDLPFYTKVFSYINCVYSIVLINLEFTDNLLQFHVQFSKSRLRLVSYEILKLTRLTNSGSISWTLVLDPLGVQW